jgi:hypothetical protein
MLDALLVSTACAPALAYTDDEFCQGFQEASATSKKDAGTWIDAATRFDGIVVLCGVKTVTFKKYLNRTLDKMESNWRTKHQRGWNDIYCNQEVWKAAILQGWSVIDDYDSPIGEHTSFFANC